MIETTSTEDQLKEKFQSTRCIVAHLYSLLIWERIEYLFIIIAFNSLFFLLVWFSDMSVLSTLSIIGLFVTLFDYFAPIISQSFLESKYWDKEAEAKYDKAITEMVNTCTLIVNAWNSWHHLKMNKPKLYFPIIFVFLFFFAYIANIVNNLLITYLFTTFLLLYPGLQHQGYFKKWLPVGIEERKKSL